MRYEYTIKIEQILEFKRRKYSRYAMHKALKNGQLQKPEYCQNCQKNGDIDAHHIDYGKPLEVLWLCKKCHGQAHRKNSHLNPNNHKQTPLPMLEDQYEKVTVTFQIPVSNFMYLFTEAEKNGKSVSKLVENEILKSFPIHSNQLQFNFMEDYGQRSREDQERIYSMDNHAEESKTESTIYDLSSMGHLPEFLSGDGADAERLQLVGNCS